MIRNEFISLNVDDNKDKLKTDYNKFTMEAGLFDNEKGVINMAVYEKLKANPNTHVSSHFTKRPWFGRIWYDGERWFEMVLRGGNTIGLYCSTNVEDLMLGVNQLYEN